MNESNSKEQIQLDSEKEQILIEKIEQNSSTPSWCICYKKC
ncbi:hypothetical protein ACQV2X_07670 [Facklamia sp. P12945]